jgi:hypothetical protein
MPNPDTNIENYTIPELLTILDLDNDPTSDEINEKTDYYIEKFTAENNPEMVGFFQDMQNTLLQYFEADNKGEAGKTPSARQTDDWFENEALKQSNPEQSGKNTDRKQKIDVYNNPHVPMKREHLGVSNTFSLPVAQDVLNPNLKNTTSRIIVLDSQYRQSTSPAETATDYTLDLSEPLLNVLSLRLYSFSIPYTWYAIDAMYGNTCFWLTFVGDDGTPITSVKISIEPGNYSNTSIVTALIASIGAAGIDTTTISAIPGYPVPPNTIQPVYMNQNNSKITLNLYGATYSYEGLTLTIDTTTIITFFDPGADLSCNSVCAMSIAINQTLGWVLGFRVPVVNVIQTGNNAIAIPELYGPKYFILVIDDLNQNHINSGLIGITEMSKTVKLPSYYSPDLPYTCIPANPSGTNVAYNSLALANDEDAGTLIIDKLDATYAPTARVLPSAPRILTQSQIYTINEILKNNGRTYNYKLKAPVVSDTFAILPIKLGSMKMGDVNTEFGGSMQDNKRIYFGPVNISRLRVKLLDDRGNIVNLNGCDWCVTLLSENLYQY